MIYLAFQRFYNNVSIKFLKAYFWSKQGLYSVSSTIQGHTHEEQNCQNDVRECCSEIYSLKRELGRGMINFGKHVFTKIFSEANFPIFPIDFLPNFIS